MPNIDLTPEHEQFIEALVASARLTSAGEVMVHALRLMQQGEERRERFVTMLRDVSTARIGTERCRPRRSMPSFGT